MPLESAPVIPFPIAEKADEIAPAIRRRLDQDTIYAARTHQEDSLCRRCQLPFDFLT